MFGGGKCGIRQPNQEDLKNKKIKLAYKILIFKSYSQFMLYTIRENRFKHC